ncbi:hypothetical protein PC113_g1111 [Phytophthora cactorum]|uniref:Protein kinase domain-containing protein n=1 Tax=Phytophthora cactorum TaxID=29920 RepID=A0A8T1ET18_9STRA|nr:hypothetical protein PC113_g1111 [Phytophthora cactorum]KAG2933687.1 hypothetical protein PC114_g1369 [Phytophthora cactorum]KAG2943577.1 hypothetical protein PC115_g759 [Phytophthora cactorum]KAG2954704.1 hypothetical protein PC117_g942 [Phytophthora cactorum]KAG4056168.1 hypothetical protein PC123_g8768 [Phytophthora cactorum]
MTTPDGVKVSNKFAAPLDGSQFDMGVTLGTGSFGRVRFATHKATNTGGVEESLSKKLWSTRSCISFYREDVVEEWGHCSACSIS